MTLKSRLKGVAIGAYVGGAGQRLRTAAAEVSRRVRRQPRAVDFYHDPLDPWSYLLAQVVQRLSERYPVEWRFHAVSTPAADVDPQPQLRRTYALRDARELAAHWDLDFPANIKDMDQHSVRWTGAVLIRERPFADQLRAAIELGSASWRNDHPELLKKVGAWGHEAHVAVPPGLSREYTALRNAGHYQGAMLSYNGEWYWGIDRIRYLEEQLAADTGVALGTGVLAARPALEPSRLIPGEGPVPLDVWYSYRSPYSYLAIERIAEITARHQVELTLRPILPMVERGLAVPTMKRMYIVRDAKREADRLGIPFGQIADPLGDGVANCIAITKLAIDRGLGLEFARSAMKGIWSEALDVASYVDLRTVVERAGLPWEDAKTALADESWRAWAKLSADDLLAIGLWGVPSFRAGDYSTWGQDRLDFLEDRLRRHEAAPPEPIPAAATE
jgi:2-hydroxychromene-2-carboxylate isomerase